MGAVPGSVALPRRPPRRAARHRPAPLWWRADHRRRQRLGVDGEGVRAAAIAAVSEEPLRYGEVGEALHRRHRPRHQRRRGHPRHQQPHDEAHRAALHHRAVAPRDALPQAPALDGGAAGGSPSACGARPPAPPLRPAAAAAAAAPAAASAAAPRWTAPASASASAPAPAAAPPPRPSHPRPRPRSRLPAWPTGCAASRATRPSAARS